MFCEKWSVFANQVTYINIFSQLIHSLHRWITMEFEILEVPVNYSLCNSLK